MRVTIALLGYELDITLGLADATSPASDDTGEALNGGTTSGYFVGFTPHDGQDVAMPQRCPAWDEPEESGRR